MNKNTAILSLVLMFFAAALIAQTTPATAAKLMSTKGTVTIKTKTDPQFKKATISSKLSGDTYIKTEAASTADIMLVGGSILTVKESSMVLINDMLVKKDKGKNSIGVCFGKVDVAVKKLTKDEAFNVMSPSAVLGVRGTKFEVETLNDGSSVVKVKEGVVQVDGDKGASATVKSNQNAAADFYNDSINSNVDTGKFAQDQNDFAKKSPDKVMEKMTGKMQETVDKTAGNTNVSQDNIGDSSDKFRKEKCMYAGMSETAKKIWSSNPTDKVVKMYYDRAKKIDARYAEVSKMIEARLQRVDQLYKEKSDKLDKKFKDAGSKLDDVDAKMKAMDSKIDSKFDTKKTNK